MSQFPSIPAVTARWMTPGEILERYGVNVYSVTGGCRSCGGSHARARSKMRCYARWRRRFMRRKPLRPWRLTPAGMVFQATGDAMRRIEREMKDNLDLSSHPRVTYGGMR